MTELRVAFVEEMMKENYRKAQDILLAMGDTYKALGFSSEEEKQNFQKVVVWFDQQAVEQGLL